MIFNSLEFLALLFIVFNIYWLTGRDNVRTQNALLVVASYIFYGWWDYRFLSLIFISSLVDYIVGQNLERSKSPGKRKTLLIISLAANLGLLGFFKYFNFFIDSFSTLLGALGLHADPHTLGIILPVGISFYTFQTLSYTIDIYRKRIPATKDPIAFFAFVCFFPQLVAGPIERAKNMLPQFLKERKFDPADAADGFRQMLWGFFKKVVIADNLSAHVETIFSSSGQQNGFVLFLGTFFFAIQIYCDFSGYSDIAIGVARFFGFRLMRNFAFPYFSRDIAEFWRKWHISLSSWFRDYVYIPLGGSFVNKPRRLFNVLITFTISGFWHGANWTFLVWGLLHGCYYIPIMLRDKQKRYADTAAKGRLFPAFNEFISIQITFLMTLFAWIFFRAESLAMAFNYIGQFAINPLPARADIKYLFPILNCLLILFIEWLQREKQHALEIANLILPLRWLIYIILFLVILVFGNFGGQEFIYFQF